MIISIHVPKTAGSSFRTSLQRTYGQRLLVDNEDWPELRTPEGDRHNVERREAMLQVKDQLAENYAAIHGHFAASKYADVFSDGLLTIFFRNPYQHTISTYEHARRTSSNRPDHQRFLDRDMSIFDLLEMVPDHQSMYLGGVEPDALAFVGVAEQYARSVRTFRAVCGVPDLSEADAVNVNPSRGEMIAYEVSEDLRRAVNTHREGDLRLYRRATERLEQLAARYAI